LPDSIACRSHTRFSWSAMCSISYAIVPVYVALRRGKASASVSPVTYMRRTAAGTRA
jgi:hypothetical protein